MTRLRSALADLAVFAALLWLIVFCLDWGLK